MSNALPQYSNNQTKESTHAEAACTDWDLNESHVGVPLPRPHSPGHHSHMMPSPPIKIGNPGPVGLVAFGITTMMLNFLNAGITTNAAGLVMAYGIFHGGFVQIIAGCFEMLKGNTFAAVAFLSYGGFWMGIALFDLMALSGNINGDTQSGKCVWLVIWGVFTLGMFINTFRINRALQFVFGSLTLLFFLLAGGVYSSTVNKIAGAVGIACGLAAMLTGLAEVTNEVHERELIPLGKMKKA